MNPVMGSLTRYGTYTDMSCPDSNETLWKCPDTNSSGPTSRSSSDREPPSPLIHPLSGADTITKTIRAARMLSPLGGGQPSLDHYSIVGNLYNLDGGLRSDVSYRRGGHLFEGL